LGADVILPDFYLKSSPEDVGHLSSVPINFNLEECKQIVNAYFVSQKTTLYIVMDKLDEFVIEEDYKTQKLMLQGLIGSVLGYVNHEKLVLKVFLRNDLFKHLDFSKVGYAKAKERTVELFWDSLDIFELISQRIAWNYLHILKMPAIQVTINKESYCFARQQDENGVKKKFIDLIERICKWFVDDKSHVSKIDKSTVRDEINKILITSILPRRIEHKNIDGVNENIEIWAYLKTHFKVSSGSINPRIVIMFLNYCRELAVERFDKDFIKSIQLNAVNEFELIKKIVVLDAYVEVQKISWEEVAQTDPKWKPYVGVLRENKKQGTMKYDFVKKITVLSEEELHSFLAFLSHSGVLINKSPEDTPHQNRKYELPIIYKKIFN